MPADKEAEEPASARQAATDQNKFSVSKRLNAVDGLQTTGHPFRICAKPKQCCYVPGSLVDEGSNIIERKMNKEVNSGLILGYLFYNLIKPNKKTKTSIFKRRSQILTGHTALKKPSSRCLSSSC